MSKKDVETTIIKLNDDYSSCTGDSCNMNSKDDNRRSPKGYVEVYELDESIDVNDKNLSEGKFHGRFKTDEAKVKKDNLILYLGREWLVSEIFGVNNENIDAEPNDKIYWFGVGDGGAPEGDPFNPTNPVHTDSVLDSAIMINESTSEYGDYRETPTQGNYKKLLNSVEFEQDELNDNYYLVAKATMVLTSADANGNIINEAGLFTAPDNTGGFNGRFTIFSRVTFPSISKTETRQLVFVWYIYT